MEWARAWVEKGASRAISNAMAAMILLCMAAGASRGVMILKLTFNIIIKERVSRVIGKWLKGKGLG